MCEISETGCKEAFENEWHTFKSRELLDFSCAS